MNWKKERDLLISQTMAFVQSVTGKTPDFEQASVARPDVAKPDVAKSEIVKSHMQAAPVVQAAPDVIKVEPAKTVQPVEGVQSSTEIPRAIFPNDVRTEMQARVANFRAHQERFNREREEYFSSTLTRARAGIRNETTPDPSDRTTNR